MGWMNFCFYLSLRYIPLGIAVALEFSGPAGVGHGRIAPRRRFRVDSDGRAGIAGAAAAGLGLPNRCDLLGVALRARRPAPAGRSTFFSAARRAPRTADRPPRLGTVIGAIMIVPIGFAHSRHCSCSHRRFCRPALGVALLSSALPYSLEMLAMPRLPTRTFGVLMSLDPALGAVAGLIFLGETLDVGFNGRRSPASWPPPPAAPRPAGRGSATARLARSPDTGLPRRRGSWRWSEISDARDSSPESDRWRRCTEKIRRTARARCRMHCRGRVKK